MPTEPVHGAVDRAPKGASSAAGKKRGSDLGRRPAHEGCDEAAQRAVSFGSRGAQVSTRHRRRRQSAQTRSRFVQLPPFGDAPDIEDKVLRNGIIRRHPLRAHVTRITSYRSFSAVQVTAKRRLPVRARRVPAGHSARLSPDPELNTSCFAGRGSASTKAVKHRAPACLLSENQILAGKSRVGAAGGTVSPRYAEPGRRAIRRMGRRARFREGVRAFRVFSASASRSASRHCSPEKSSGAAARPLQTTAARSRISRSCSRCDSAAGPRESGKMCRHINKF